MKIIADTNIWYYLSQEVQLLEKSLQLPIYPTFINIYELSKSHNLIDNEELSRAAIRMLFKFQKNVILESPIIHITKLHQEYDYNPLDDVLDLLQFTERFAKGYRLDRSRINGFKNILDKTKSEFDEAANFMNEEAERIRKNITDKKKHKKIDTHQVTAGFINFAVEVVTKGSCNLDQFDLNKIELLLSTLDHFFKTLETSKMKFQANDWYDFTILGYVQPGDKYWTREKRWINLITDAGCEEYLFKE